MNWCVAVLSLLVSCVGAMWLCLLCLTYLLVVLLVKDWLTVRTFAALRVWIAWSVLFMIGGLVFVVFRIDLGIDCLWKICQLMLWIGYLNLWVCLEGCWCVMFGFGCWKLWFLVVNYHFECWFLLFMLWICMFYYLFYGVCAWLEFTVV